MESIIRIFSSFIEDYLLRLLKKPRKAEIGKVHLPKMLAAIGGITAVFFLILFVASYADGEKGVSIFFLGFAAMGTLLIIAYFNCRISYDDDGFVAKTFFGIKRRATYDQVTAMKENMRETYIYFGKRRVMVDELAVGGKEFIGFVRKKYRVFHNGQSLPKIYKKKKDIFNGHVNDVAGFYLAFGLVGAFIIGTMCFVVISICMPKSINNTLEQTISFISYEVNDDEVVLTSSDNQIYKIQYSPEDIDIQKIKAICNGKSEVTAYSKEVTADGEKPFYSVKAISYNDSFILSFDETNRLNRQNAPPVIGFFSVVLLFLAVLCGVTVYIGRNPHKFSKRVVRLFFKDGYINY